MKQRLTQSDEEKKINFEVYQVRKKLFKLNKELKYYQITGIEITHSEVMMAPIVTHWNLWGRFKNWFKSKHGKQD